MDLIRRGPAALKAVRAILQAAGRSLADGSWRAAPRDPVTRPVARAQFLSPIPRPAKHVFCMGRNYAEHAKERGAEVPTVPVFFTKPPTAVTGHDAPVT